MGLFRLLDVAVGPFILIFGIGILLLVAVITGLVYFSVKAIIKIKKERDTNDSNFTD